MSSRRPPPTLDAVLYVAFFLTGVCVAAPGALLPLLFQLWRLNDAKAGVLLFGFFVGSSLGGLSARGSLRLAFLLSCTLGSASALALGLQSLIAPLLCLTVFGFALGVCMTSVSLQQSRAHGGRRVAELTRLNLVWAAGALSGPALCLRIGSIHGPGTVFRSMAVLFLLIWAATLLQPKEPWQAAPPPAAAGARNALHGIWPVLLMIPLSTGLESSAGGWLTTYASRTGLHLSADIGLTSIFWAGMLLCRMAYTSQRISARVTFALRFNTLLALAGIGALCFGRPASVLFAGAFCLGWGLGALYPIALALLLKQTELGNWGFLIAGFGSACLPLLTGFVSQTAHSLRAGVGFLLLPAVCLAVLGNVTARGAAYGRTSGG